MNLIKTFFIYLSTSVLNKAIPFLLLPVITKYLTPQEYGAYGMYQVILSFLAPFVGMSLQTNITRNFFKVSKDKIAQIITSILLILHLNVFVSIIIIFLITLVFHNPFGIPNNILYIMPIIIYVQTINTFNLTILRNAEKALQYGIIETIITIFNLLVALILLLIFKQGWFSLVYGTLFAHLILSIYSIRYFIKVYNIKINDRYSFKEIYAISLPLVFHNIGGSIIFLSDRIFIQQMNGLNDVGIYMIGSQFGMITMIIINTIVTTINPWLFRSLANNRNIKKEIFLLMILYLVIALIVWIISLVLFPYMINEKYSNAKIIILWVSLGYGIRGWYQIFHAIIVHEGKTNIFMYITIIAGMVNLILNYVLIKINGMVGAAQATLVAFIIMFIMTFYYANKFSKMN
jgi:O-antigen/teichoic acid export membrane protein